MPHVCQPVSIKQQRIKSVNNKGLFSLTRSLPDFTHGFTHFLGHLEPSKLLMVCICSLRLTLSDTFIQSIIEFNKIQKNAWPWTLTFRSQTGSGSKRTENIVWDLFRVVKCPVKLVRLGWEPWLLLPFKACFTRLSHFLLLNLFFYSLLRPILTFFRISVTSQSLKSPCRSQPRPVVSCGPQALVLIIQRMETGFSATSQGQTQMSVYQETMAGHAAHYVGLNRCFPLPPYAAGSPGSAQNSLRWLWPLSSTSQISRWVFLLPIWICIITSPMTITGA